MRTEERLRDVLSAGLAEYEESPDLFARVQRSVEEDVRRRRVRRRLIAGGAVVAAALGALLFLVVDVQSGAGSIPIDDPGSADRRRLAMDWWILELLVNALLVGLALWLGPFIKRFGKSYAADIFRSTPRTGKSFIVLTDFAYYLIFGAYVLFTLRFEPRPDWGELVSAAQLQYEAIRLGGILLIIGVLHGFNLLVLPIVGRLLTLNLRLDRDTPRERPPHADP